MYSKGKNTTLNKKRKKEINGFVGSVRCRIKRGKCVMEIVNNNYQTVFESLGNCLFFHIDYTMPGRKRQRPIRVVVVFDLLVGHSVWKMSARFTFRT